MTNTKLFSSGTRREEYGQGETHKDSQSTGDILVLMLQDGYRRLYFLPSFSLHSPLCVCIYVYNWCIYTLLCVCIYIYIYIPCRHPPLPPHFPSYSEPWTYLPPSRSSDPCGALSSDLCFRLECWLCSTPSSKHDDHWRPNMTSFILYTDSRGHHGWEGQLCGEVLLRR